MVWASIPNDSKCIYLGSFGDVLAKASQTGFGCDVPTHPKALKLTPFRTFLAKSL